MAKSGAQRRAERRARKRMCDASLAHGTVTCPLERTVYMGPDGGKPRVMRNIARESFATRQIKKLYLPEDVGADRKVWNSIKV